MVSTSLAVASLVSAWLVPPYLALMGAILFAPLGRRDEAAEPDPALGEKLAGPEGIGAGIDDRPGASGRVEPSRAGPATPADPSSGPCEDPVATSEPGPAKARRGKGRGRGKKAKPVVEPADATWIRVGPGKFVRADAATPAVTVEESSPTATSEPDPTPLAPTDEAGAGGWDEGLVERVSPDTLIPDETSPVQDEAMPQAASGPFAAAIEPTPEGEGVIPPSPPDWPVAADESVPERAEASPGDAAGPVVGWDSPDGPPAPITDVSPSECAEGPPPVAPGPGDAAEEGSPTRGGAATVGAPGPDVAACAPISECEGDNPPTAPGPDAAAVEPEPSRAAVEAPSGPGPIPPADEPTPEPARASPWDESEWGRSLIVAKTPEFAGPGDGLERTEGGLVEGRWPHVEGGQAFEEDVETAWAVAEVGNDADAPRAEGPGPGSAVEGSDDNGNAPEASDLGRPAAPEPATPEGDREEGRPMPAHAPDRPSRTTGTLLLSLQGAWPPGPRAPRVGRNAASLIGRGIRSGRKHRGLPDLRHRTRRESGRSRQARRTFPPRPPPASVVRFRRRRGGLGSQRWRPGTAPCLSSRIVSPRYLFMDASRRHAEHSRRIAKSLFSSVLVPEVGM